MKSMSKRITINVPDHVAERLDREGNVSAFVTRVLELAMGAERDREILEAAGFRSTAEGRAWAKRVLAEARERHSPTAYDRMRRELFSA